MIEWVPSAGARNPENSLKVPWYTYCYDLNILSKEQDLIELIRVMIFYASQGYEVALIGHPQQGRGMEWKHAFKIYILK